MQFSMIGNNIYIYIYIYDSLAYEIKRKDFYKNISPYIEERIDTSDYPTNHPSGIITGLNSKVLGMFKDEACGKQIVEFLDLRAKRYSYKIPNASEDRKCKGVTKNVTKNGVFNSMTIESVCLA